MKPLAKGDFTGLKQSRVMSLQSLSKGGLRVLPNGKITLFAPVT
jgi:hypothetical protein